MPTQTIGLTDPQLRIASTDYRVDVTAAGRRGGKTFGSGARLIRAATPQEVRRYAPVVGYVAPTYGMAKRLMWSWLKSHVPSDWVRDVSISDLRMELVTGATLWLFGAQNYDTIRGLGFDHVEIDEVQDVPRDAWPEVIRPALADRKGSAGFRGTPKGRANHLFDFYDEAGWRDGWGRYSYTTLEGGLVDPEEVAIARRETDERTFRQEWEASFEDYGGLAYRNFDDVASVRESQFDPARETFLCWDFNAGERPMSVICVQLTGYVDAPTEKPGVTQSLAVFDAVHEWIYPQTNTQEMCDAILRDFEQWNYTPEHNGQQRQIGRLWVTGDASGHRRESSASASDYAIIERAFKRWPKYERRTNTVRHIADRLNATNTLFRRGDGLRRLYVSPRCQKLRRALVRVTVAENGKLVEVTLGELDPTDALSYFPYNFHPVHKKSISDYDWA